MKNEELNEGHRHMAAAQTIEICNRWEKEIRGKDFKHQVDKRSKEKVNKQANILGNIGYVRSP